MKVSQWKMKLLAFYVSKRPAYKKFGNNVHCNTAFY